MLSNLARVMAERKRTMVAIFFSLLLVAMWAVSSVTYVFGHGWQMVSQHAIAGDEPHYLMVINSILFDHDLDLRDDYARMDQGGLEAGARFQGDWVLDHQTIVVDRRTGKHAVWRPLPREYWAMMDILLDRRRELKPLKRRLGPPEFAVIGRRVVPGADAYEVSLHPVAFPALIAAMIAPLRPAKAEVEVYAAAAVTLLGWLGALVTYFVALRAGLSRRWSLVAAGSLALASPWLAYSRSLFSEVPTGLALLLGLWAFACDWPAVAGLCVAASMAMKPPFMVVGVGFATELLIAKRWRSLFRFVVVLGGLAAVLFTFNYWLAREPLLPPATSAAPTLTFNYWRGRKPLLPPATPVAPTLTFNHLRGGKSLLLPATSAAPTLTHIDKPHFDPGSASSLARIGLIIYRFFESLIALNYGLFWYAPWAAFALWSIANRRARRGQCRDLQDYMSFPCGLYFLLLASLALLGLNSGYAPGFCYGPRYWVPFLPWLAIAFAAQIAASGRGKRWSLAAVAMVAATISISGAIRYRHLFDKPFYASLCQIHDPRMD